jgi:hypothetical protein
MKHLQNYAGIRFNSYPVFWLRIFEKRLDALCRFRAASIDYKRTAGLEMCRFLALELIGRWFKMLVVLPL